MTDPATYDPRKIWAWDTESGGRFVPDACYMLDPLILAGIFICLGLAEDYPNPLA